MSACFEVAPTTAEPRQEPADVVEYPSAARYRLNSRLRWLCIYMFAAWAFYQPVLDPDIWWHLRTGQWIVEHGNVPQTDPFSSYAKDQPWIAYSWLFEVIVYRLDTALGLPGVVLYRAGMSLAIMVAIHMLVARRVRRTLICQGIVVVTMIALFPILYERSLLFSILGFTLTLDAVLAIRAGQRARAAWLLPILYVVWANWHIQFIYGLMTLALATGTSLLETWWARRADGGARRLALLSALCFLATLCNPYHFRLYPLVGELASQQGFYDIILEMQAPKFRDLGDWCVLALALSAAFAFGRMRRWQPFEMLLFAAAVLTSFRSKRDIWLLAVTAAAILGQVGWLARVSFLSPRIERRLLALATLTLMLTALIATQLLITRVLTYSHNLLEQAAATLYPTRAADFVQREGYRGKLYNRFDWGGYLLWRFSPEMPVCIDNRSNLYGPERVDRIRRVWFGFLDWQADPELVEADVIVGRSNSPLAHVLRHDPRSPFRIVYEDELAVVCVRKVRGGREP